MSIPRLIVFEGADAVGKCEMSTRLVDEINKMPGRKAVRIAFPRYETLVGKAILRHLKKETALVDLASLERRKMLLDKLVDHASFIINRLAGQELLQRPKSALEAATIAFMETFTPSKLDALAASGLFSERQLVIFGTILEESTKVMEPPDLKADITPPVITAPEDALVFQCMMIADKYHATIKIKKAMADGYDVVLDRWHQSAEAFGASDGLDVKWLAEVHEQLPRGDVNILLDVSAEESARRRPAFRDRYEVDRGAQERIRAIYRGLWTTEWAKGNAPPAWIVIDAGQTRDEVFKQIMDAYQA